tara:strand:+ start:311 stop:502 length:192 start_codon:yes stop_codon:yes gene_type:complete
MSYRKNYFWGSQPTKYNIKNIYNDKQFYCYAIKMTNNPPVGDPEWDSELIRKWQREHGYSSDW